MSLGATAPIPGQPGIRTLVRGQLRQVVPLRYTLPEKNAETRIDVVVIDGRLYTTLGQPLINYNAVHPSGPLGGRPVLKMLQAQKGQAGSGPTPRPFRRRESTRR